MKIIPLLLIAICCIACSSNQPVNNSHNSPIFYDLDKNQVVDNDLLTAIYLQKNRKKSCDLYNQLVITNREIGIKLVKGKIAILADTLIRTLTVFVPDVDYIIKED
jgi:hypothetical protein